MKILLTCVIYGESEILNRKHLFFGNVNFLEHVMFSGTCLEVAVNFYRKLAQTSPKLKTDFENKVKNLEHHINDEDKFNEYKTAKNESKSLYNNIATGVQVK